MNNNNIDQIVAEKLRQTAAPTPSPQMPGRIMLAVAKKARRRAVVRTIRNVAVGVLAAVAVVLLIGAGLSLAMQVLGLQAVVEQLDSYVNEMLVSLRALASSTTFGLVAFVTLVIGGVMIWTQWQADRAEAKHSERK